MKGKEIGNLYLADKLSTRSGTSKTIEFTSNDQELLEMFATQAAVAIENAQLYQQTQQLAVLEERERFAMALHDGIIQSIYAIGLMLEDVQHRAETAEPIESDLVRAPILGLNEVIRDIRNYILDLRPERFQGRNIVSGLEELVRDLRANSLMDVDFIINPEGDFDIDPVKTSEILHIAKEALFNIRKHARASKVSLSFEGQGENWRLEIKDNGLGFDAEDAQGGPGNGLLNMRGRARSLGGFFQIVSSEKIGTQIVVTIPR